jgi:hypothetical protein
MHFLSAALFTSKLYVCVGTKGCHHSFLFVIQLYPKAFTAHEFYVF